MKTQAKHFGLAVGP